MAASGNFHGTPTRPILKLANWRPAIPRMKFTSSEPSMTRYATPSLQEDTRASWFATATPSFKT
jgi:hypothetical protein